jgi:hypothetical protein
MRRAVTLAVLALTMVVSLPGVPASATPPSDVVIEGLAFFPPPDGPPPPGSFTATGDHICPSGVTNDVAGLGTPPSPHGFNLVIVRELVCDDGSGSIVLMLKVKVRFVTGSTFLWNVVDGTGSYEKLHGSGYGWGQPTPLADILDTYVGQMHID